MPSARRVGARRALSSTRSGLFWRWRGCSPPPRRPRRSPLWWCDRRLRCSRATSWLAARTGALLHKVALAELVLESLPQIALQSLNESQLENTKHCVLCLAHGAALCCLAVMNTLLPFGVRAWRQSGQLGWPLPQDTLLVVLFGRSPGRAARGGKALPGTAVCTTTDEGQSGGPRLSDRPVSSLASSSTAAPWLQRHAALAEVQPYVLELAVSREHS